VVTSTKGGRRTHEPTAAVTKPPLASETSYDSVSNDGREPAALPLRPALGPQPTRRAALIPFGVGALVGGGFNLATMKGFKAAAIRYYRSDDAILVES
jgi:hypothetical protein